ncbi:MAG: hypothetical protein RBJ76_04930 [Stenomitos frigidus ULC029]
MDQPSRLSHTDGLLAEYPTLRNVGFKVPFNNLVLVNQGKD